MTLYELRVRYGLSQTAVAGAARIHVDTLRAAERGMKFTLQQRRKVINALRSLKVSPDDIAAVVELQDGVTK